MSTPANQIIDIISHFIGELRIALDELRMRQDPDEANATPPPIDPLGMPSPQEQDIAAEDVGIGDVESSDYALEHDAPPQLAGIPLHLNLPHIKFPMLSSEAEYYLPKSFAMGIKGPTPLAGPPPSSLIAVVNQHTFLFDEDTVIVGTPGIAAPTPIQPIMQLAALETEARDATGGLSSLSPVLSVDEFDTFVTSTHKLIVEADPEIVTASGPVLSGIWVNGVQIEDGAPKLDDSLPHAVSLKKAKELDLTKEDEPENGDTSSAELVLDASLLHTTMNISSGHNLTVNEAVLVGAGVTATTMAVNGNHYSLDVIVQVNALSSASTVDSELAELFGITANDDATVNLAKFTTITHDKGAQKAADNPDDTPDNWTITIVDSDLIFFNWLYQYSFTADGDSLVLTATGTTTTIGTGGNMSMNSTGITYMGMTYDLLLIGGSLYDVNYISQINILYDHDTLSMFGPMPNNSGTVETGGNVLWNEAQIVNVGASEWTHEMPDHYADTMKRLDKGNYTMPKSLGNDENFTGTSHLNVLYVKGNVYDINYIEQVNVVGDADQVIFYAEQAFGKDVDWTVHTGGNVLINAAAIVDYEGMGNTAYVAGNVYSEALLIQSEIIHTGNDQPAEIVNEVVAFISDDADQGIDDAAHALQVAAMGGYTPDGLDSMLA